MAKFGLILTEGPFQTQNWEIFVNIAEAALDKGHEVEGFLYIDGVYNAIKHQRYPDMDPLPVKRFQKLVEKGMKLINCGICVNARGLQDGKEYFEGAEVGGLPDMADILGEADVMICL